MAEKRAHVFISGRVQGVGFRFNTVRRAESVGVDGWVRNLRDGRVEAVYQGDEDAVERMLSWSRRGPASAQVQDVDVQWEEPQQDGGGFRVRR